MEGREMAPVPEVEMLTEQDGRPVVETRFHVRYHETDAMGIVHHASYVLWFEEGRSAYTRVLGLPYAQMAAEGILLAVTEVSARFHRPARYDDEIIVRTWLDKVHSRGMSFGYVVLQAASGQTLVTGRTSHVSVDPMGNVVRLPERMRAWYDHSYQTSRA